MGDRIDVEAMIGAGVPFDQIEVQIEAMGASDEAKSALWLLAWSARGNDDRRRSPVEHPAEVLPDG